MDREKEIKTMLEDLKCPVMEGGECRKSISCEECISGMLVDAGYRKIPKDAVVLSRDKYNELRSRPDNCIYIDISKDYVKECQKEIDKAVGERTIAIIRDLIGHRFAYYLKDETNGTVTCCADYVVDADDVKFLEEKYKVEVGK